MGEQQSSEPEFLQPKNAKGTHDNHIRVGLLKLTTIEWVVVIASMLTIIGSFLPWATLSIFGFSHNVNGIEGDGVVTLIFGLVALAILATYATVSVNRRWQARCRLGIWIAGAIVFVVALVNVIDIASTPLASPAVGVILVLIGGLGQIASSSALLIKSKSEGKSVFSSIRQLDEQESDQAAVLPSAENDKIVDESIGGAEFKPRKEQEAENYKLSSDIPGSARQQLEGTDAGARAKLQPSSIVVTVNGSVLLKSGAFLMVLSTLLSWDLTGEAAFPNVAGANPLIPGGVGIGVFVVGLLLLLRHWPYGVILGQTLASFALTVIYLSTLGAGGRGAGSWLGLVGTGVATGGAILMFAEFGRGRTAVLIRISNAGIGAVLATVASFWLEWTFGLSGIDPESPFGIPVLIMGGLALVITITLVTGLASLKSHSIALVFQTAGTLITVIAGTNVLAALFAGTNSIYFSSGPLVACAGGILLMTAVDYSPKVQSN